LHRYEVEPVDPVFIEAEDGVWQSIKWMQLYFTDPHLIVGRDPPPICEFALNTGYFIYTFILLFFKKDVYIKICDERCHRKLLATT